MAPHRTCLLGVTLQLLTPAGALAFSSSGPFASEATVGGSGGRWFTGSVQDGFTCQVCHQGGEEPQLNFQGFPDGGLYFPGEAYNFVVTWPEEENRVGGALEFTDLAGKAVGELSLPPTEDLEASERCDVSVDASIATAVSLRPLEEDEREVLHLARCGTTQLRFTWTAPAEGLGPIEFSSSFVLGNGSGDPTGDGSVAPHRIFQQAGVPEDVSTASSSCSAVGSGALHSDTVLLTLCLLLLGSRKRMSRGERRGEARC